MPKGAAQRNRSQPEVACRARSRSELGRTRVAGQIVTSPVGRAPPDRRRHGWCNESTSWAMLGSPSARSAPSGTPDAAVPVSLATTPAPAAGALDAQHAALVTPRCPALRREGASAGPASEFWGPALGGMGDRHHRCAGRSSRAGALLIWRVRILQARKGEVEIGSDGRYNP